MLLEKNDIYVKLNRTKNLLKSSNGWAMPLALLIVMVTALLSAALFNYAMLDTKAVQSDETREQAKYLARSGVEAVIKSWKDAPITAKPTGDMETVYLMKDKSYKRDSELSITQKSNDAVGKLNVHVTKNSDGTTTFDGTAMISGITQKISATSTPYSNGMDLGWYSRTTDRRGNEYYYINTSTYDTETVTVHTLFGNRTETIYIHKPSGIVECNTNSSNDKALLFDYEENVAFSAQAMFFHCPLNFQDNVFDSSVLVASGQNIIFDKRIDLRNTIVPILGTTSYNTLVLHVPESLGIKLEGKSGLYGKVYFGQDVVLHDSWGSDLTIRGPQAFYFRRKMDSSGKEHGIDLVEWLRDRDGKIYNSDDFFSDSFNKPNPQDLITFIWK